MYVNIIHRCVCVAYLMSTCMCGKIYDPLSMGPYLQIYLLKFICNPQINNHGTF